MILKAEVTETMIQSSATVEIALALLDASSYKILLVVDGELRLVGTLTDGDIRRGFINGFHLSAPVKAILNPNPKTLLQDVADESILQVMLDEKVNLVPLVDSKNIPRKIAVLSSSNRPVAKKEATFVIMAGGEGKRLWPLTKTTPKPMLPLGRKPMLEHVIDRAINDGFTDFIVAVHYLAHVITDYFGDGSSKGVRIRYFEEKTPLGTGGALGQMSGLNENAPVVVCNADVISDLRFSRLLEYHNSSDAVATMAVVRQDWQNPYGVVHLDGDRIVGFEEKPVVTSFINAGVYVFDPLVLRYLPCQKRYDIPDIFELLSVKGLSTIVYPIKEDWNDVGHHSVYEKLKGD